MTSGPIPSPATTATFADAIVRKLLIGYAALPTFSRGPWSAAGLRPAAKRAQHSFWVQVCALCMSIPFYWRTGASQDRRVCINGDATTIWATTLGETLAFAVGLWIVWAGDDGCNGLLDDADDRSAKLRSATRGANSAREPGAAEPEPGHGIHADGSAPAASIQCQWRAGDSNVFGFIKHRATGGQLAKSARPAAVAGRHGLGAAVSAGAGDEQSATIADAGRPRAES